jgi:hypothetical protein
MVPFPQTVSGMPTHCLSNASLMAFLSRKPDNIEALN